MDRYIYRWIDRQMDGQIDGWIDIYTYSDIETVRWTDRYRQLK